MTSYPELRSLMSNVPDYRAMFLRGYGSQNFNSGGYGNVIHSSGGIGAVQGDSIRADSGTTGGFNTLGYPNNAFGVFKNVWNNRAAISGGHVGVHHINIGFEMFYNSPKSNEIRPINKAVKYLIRAQ